MRHSLWIFVGMFGGAILGLLLAGQEGQFAKNLLDGFDFFGKTVFIGALKMIVAPLILFSILAGVTSLPTTGELWNIGWKTLAFYFATTSIAVTLGLFFVLTIQPGTRGAREDIRAKWETQYKQEIQEEYAGKEGRIEQVKSKTAFETIEDNVRQVVQNPFKALTNGNTLGIIFWAILMGIALVVIGKEGAAVVPVIIGINKAIMKITGWIMWAAPFFIFCLVGGLVGRQGADVFELLFWYVLTVLVAIAAHICVLLTICKFVGKRSPTAFLLGIRRAWATAFSTRSSAATLPVTMEAVTTELKVPKKISDFVLPLGATMNMDGTALYEGVAIIFLIQLFEGMPGAPVDLTFVMTLVIFLTAVLASIGAAAVPDAGLITMVLVANAVGLDVGYIGLIFAVDAFLDMFRTSTNVMGDAVGSVVVARWERDAIGEP